ncbi:hypothetical protein MTO96_047960 [Rhipicephalus appendiculatus]
MQRADEAWKTHPQPPPRESREHDAAHPKAVKSSEANIWAQDDTGWYLPPGDDAPKIFLVAHTCRVARGAKPGSVAGIRTTRKRVRCITGSHLYYYYFFRGSRAPGT